MVKDSENPFKYISNHTNKIGRIIRKTLIDNNNIDKDDLFNFNIHSSHINRAPIIEFLVPKKGIKIQLIPEKEAPFKVDIRAMKAGRSRDFELEKRIVDESPKGVAEWEMRHLKKLIPQIMDGLDKR